LSDIHMAGMLFQPISIQDQNYLVYNEEIRHKGVWYIANVPQLSSVLMQNVSWSAWTQPLAVVYWPYTTNPLRCIIAIRNWLPM
jgi:hypothetical protein